MLLIAIIAGAFLGVLLADTGRTLLGMGMGVALGILFAKMRDLEAHVRRLQHREPAPRASTAEANLAVPTPPIEQQASAEPNEASARAAATSPAPPAADLFAPQSGQEPQIADKKASPLSPLDRLYAAAKGWLSTGNAPVKVGIIILFFGVAFLFKYAVDNRILVLPVELRLLAVSVLAGIVFAVGWRLRDKSRVYALNLQGGGIGLLYLTIYAAFRLYAVLPASVALALLVLLTLASGVLAVRQNARGLATFASIGGFLAPLLTSTGQGSHVVLFSYYLLINAAILGISWFRAWRSLNLFGFAFTFVVGTYWGFQYYTPELYSSTQPFLVLNFLFYQAIAILYAFRQPPRLRGLVDGSIIFGTPAIVFSLQTQLVSNSQWGLAISAGVISFYYASVATWLRRRYPEQMLLLTQSMLVLAVGFATIAVPLALDDRWSAIAWALEGAGVVWLGVRQHGVLARLTGTALIVGSSYFYLAHGWRDDAGFAVINGNVLGGLIISCASIYAARLLATDTQKMPRQSAISVALLLWGALWWLATGVAEIDDRTSGELQINLYIMFHAASFALLGLLGRHLDWIAARRLTFAYLPLLMPLALMHLRDNEHLFDGWSSVAWLLALAVHFFVLHRAEKYDRHIHFVWHIAGTLLIVLMASQEAYWRVGDIGMGYVWKNSAALLIPLLAGMLLLSSRHRISWPVQRHWSAYQAAVGLLCVGQLLFLLGQVADDPGNPAPMIYIPLLNPFDMLTLAGLGVAYWAFRVWQSDATDATALQEMVAVVALGLLSFLLTTTMVVRSVHHFGDVTWDDFTLRRSVLVQSALSIYWAMLGFAGMIIGTRQQRYWAWVVGVGLMVVVVLKLIFIDYENTGTVAGIVSFLGVGGLLMVVGYFAPRPPRPGARPPTGQPELMEGQHDP